MNKSDFKKSMQCGLGRCIIELSECNDIEKYREIVLWGCLHNLSYDTQTEGTRAGYLYELVSYYQDDDYFLSPVIEKFERLPRSNCWNYQHFCELLCYFADEGNEFARIALHKKYDEIYSNLLSCSKGKNYNYDKCNFEQVCIAISSLEGLDSFLKIASDIGNLYLKKNKLECHDFEWFYVAFENREGKNSLNKIMERESKKAPAIKAFYDNIKECKEFYKCPHEKTYPIAAQEIIESTDVGRIGRLDELRFQLRADEEQKLILKQAILNETDGHRKAELLKFFGPQECPISIEELISYAESNDKKLIEIAFDFLTEIKNACVCDFAIELLTRGQNINYAICMLIKNYQKQDKDLLLNSLSKVKIDYSLNNDWHSVVHAIFDAFDEKIRLPKETLLFIYNNSLCSFCREYAVRRLAKHKLITEDIKAECAFDSNSEIREYFKKR